MVPVLEEVSVAMSDKIRVVKIDTEKNPAIANTYNIAALPTFIVFKDGKVLDRFVTFLHYLDTSRFMNVVCLEFGSAM